MDPLLAFFPELIRLHGLAKKLMLHENDAVFASLEREVWEFLMQTRLFDRDGMAPEQRARDLLHIGYIAGIEAYEREHPVEPKEEER